MSDDKTQSWYDIADQHEPAWMPLIGDDGMGIFGCWCGAPYDGDDNGMAWYADHIAALGASDYINEYWANWAGIVEAPTGQLSRDAVARELADYSVVMDQASQVYDDLTGGRISKPNTAARHVISEARDSFDEFAAHDLIEALYADMETDADRKALVDYAESLHPGVLGAYQARVEHRAVRAAELAKEANPS